jgi:capsular exopolysaccharide synthesis family protein
LSRLFDNIQSATGQTTAEQDSASFGLNSVLNSIVDELAEDIDIKQVLPATDTMPSFSDGVSSGFAGRFDSFLPESCKTVPLPELKTLFTSSGEKERQPAAEAYRVLASRVARIQLAQKWRSLVVTSSASSEGKTLTALNLGVNYTNLRHSRVLLIDADIRSHGLSATLGLQGRAGLTEVLEEELTPQEVILRFEGRELFILPAGRSPGGRPELFASSACQNFFKWMHSHFDFILVDAPPAQPFADFELISAQLDRVIFLVREYRTNRDLLKSTLDQLEKQKLLGVIYNGTSTARQYPNYADYTRTRPSKI